MTKCILQKSIKKHSFIFCPNFEVYPLQNLTAKFSRQDPDAGVSQCWSQKSLFLTTAFYYQFWFYTEKIVWSLWYATIPSPPETGWVKFMVWRVTFDFLSRPIGIKVAQNSFQHLFGWVVITTLYHFMLQSWYQKLSNHWWTCCHHFLDTIGNHSNSMTS